MQPAPSTPRPIAPIALTALLLAAGQSALACSAFLLCKGGECIMGFNENWGGSAPGFVIVNQPGCVKHDATWDEMIGGKAAAATPALMWKARYGSVTFNCFGKDLPSFGVNSVGLMNAELAFPAAKPPAPKPGERLIAFPVWQQYILDRFATVDEVLKDLTAGRYSVDFQTHQFFLADAKGGYGAVMFGPDGRVRTFSRATMRHPLLCNGFPETDPSQVAPFRPFGGQKEMGSFDSLGSTVWDQRYAKGVTMLRAYDPKALCAPAYAWNVLDMLVPGEWQFLYDARARRVYFRSKGHPALKWLDLANVRFEAGQPAMALDIQAEATGDVAAQLAPLTPERHLAMLHKSVPWGFDGPQENPEAFVRNNGEAILAGLHRFGMPMP